MHCPIASAINIFDQKRCHDGCSRCCKKRPPKQCVLLSKTNLQICTALGLSNFIGSCFAEILSCTSIHSPPRMQISLYPLFLTNMQQQSRPNVFICVINCVRKIPRQTANNIIQPLLPLRATFIHRAGVCPWF